MRLQQTIYARTNNNEAVTEFSRKREEKHSISRTFFRLLHSIIQWQDQTGDEQ